MSSLNDFETQQRERSFNLIHAMKGTKNSKTLYIINSIHNFELRNQRLNTNYYCNNLVIQFIIWFNLIDNRTNSPIEFKFHLIQYHNYLI